MYPVGDEVNWCDVDSKSFRYLYRVSSLEVFPQPFVLKPSAVGSCLLVIFVEKPALRGHHFVSFCLVFCNMVQTKHNTPSTS